jgi:transposase
VSRSLLPLNRQSEACAREGVDLDESTLADWVGACVAALDPIIQAIRCYVLSAERIHADDTGAGKAQGRHGSHLDLCPRRPSVRR